ncbi:hypothetical protein CAEBREN_03092 [Caenorhabditis brenneri]|uniref:C-type lectin domain-containing protein n=1 Tax=Caenorhabditis brenneri TaxID=135651 RepID=G0NN42_CAEBE|nr:hypothetical protein CAEBREN_03092 [Caenorhabditis brenneri]
MSTSKDELPAFQENTEPLLTSAAQRKRRNDFMLGFFVSSIIFLILIGVGAAAFVLYGLNNKIDQLINCTATFPVETMTTTVPTTVETTTENSINREMEEMEKSMEQAFKMMGMIIKGLQGLSVEENTTKSTVSTTSSENSSSELRVPELKYGDCDSEWVTVNRTETGKKYCHRFFPHKLTYEEAEKKCQVHGAHLSGFTGQSELDVLDKMLDKAKSEGVQFDNGDSVWIGARRRAACSTRQGIGEKEHGFNSDPTHPCSRRQVFEWVNGVAQNPPEFQKLWLTDFEPNFAGDVENCVVLLKGVKNIGYWPRDILGDKKLNDVPCYLKYYYFCGKEAPIVKTDE